VLLQEIGNKPATQPRMLAADLVPTRSSQLEHDLPGAVYRTWMGNALKWFFGLAAG
jgi:hypothetical protein